MGTPANLAGLVDLLCQREPRFCAVVKAHGIPSLRHTPAGLEGLLIIITEQFLSLQAAACIWARLKIRLGDCHAEDILKCPQTEFQALGLSRAKAQAFHAAAVCDFDFTNMTAGEISRTLCAIKGVGPWTSDIYLLAVLGHVDSWPAGDLALRIAVHDFLKLEKRPDITEMTRHAENWKPYRAVAARLLWSHYRGLKGLAQA